MVIEWHNIISMSYLILANYYTLFKILRDFFVAHRMYSSESSILEKSTISSFHWVFFKTVQRSVHRSNYFFRLCVFELWIRIIDDSGDDYVNITVMIHDVIKPMGWISQFLIDASNSEARQHFFQLWTSMIIINLPSSNNYEEWIYVKRKWNNWIAITDLSKLQAAGWLFDPFADCLRHFAN